MNPKAPLPPQEPFFDSNEDAWILSRYADVTAALREPNLWPLGKNEVLQETRDETGRLRVRPAVLEYLATAKLEQWQIAAKNLAETQFDRLEAAGRGEILGDFAKPWCMALAMTIIGAPAEEHARLAALGDTVFAATGEPEGSPLRAPAAAATAELDRFFSGGPVPMGEPTFIAISQTTARLLTNAWLGLFRHPGEYAWLHRNPEMIPTAIDELVRYGGIVNRIFRRATGPVRIGSAALEPGQRAALMLASANRDPEVFPDPGCLNLRRPFTGNLSLGMGRNSCAGAATVRMALSTATAALVRRFESIDPEPVDEWRVGSGFCFPLAVRVKMHPHRAANQPVLT